MCNGAICFSVLSITALISTAVDNRNTMLRCAKGREVLVELVEMMDGKTGVREREKIQRVGDEGRRRSSGGEEKEGKWGGREGEAWLR